MRTGQRVEVMEAFDIKAIKRVVAADQRNIYVCREDEFDRATAESREPICVGFGREFLLRVFDED